MKLAKQTLSYCLFVVIISFFTPFSFADTPSPTNNNPFNENLALNAPKPPVIIPQPPTLDAKSYVLIDASSGQVIAEKNMDQRVAPASLTKMMSLYLVSQALATGQIHLTDNVQISENAWKTGGSRMFVRVGTAV